MSFEPAFVLGWRGSTRLFVPLLGGLLAVAAKSGVAQQISRDSLCHQSYLTLQPSHRDVASLQLPSNAARACRAVATTLHGAFFSARRHAFNQEEDQLKLQAIQTTRGETTPNPGETTGGVEPVETAGGSVGAFASEGGSSALTTIAINPSFFVVSPERPVEVAKWSRFSDLTFLVPTSDSDEDEDGKVDYLGVRWRINITGLSAGGALVDAVSAAFNRLLAAGSTEIQSTIRILETVSADDLPACMESLLIAGRRGKSRSEIGASVAAIAAKCGESPYADDAAAADYEAFDDAIRKARFAADSRYFGLDIRGDFGDLPRFGIDTLEGSSLTVTLGFGQRYAALNSEASNGFRGGIGVKYLDPKGTTSASFAATGGLSFEVNRYYDKQRLSASGGLEFQFDNKSASDASGMTDFVAFRTSLNVPLAGTTSATISFATPVAGGKVLGPTLSVKANWRLLLARG
jgi:hypothetical protein